MAGTSDIQTPSPMQGIMLEFRAGLMRLQDKRVVPDVRKGLVRVVRGDEGLVHFQWLDRTNNNIEIDQIIFPDEAIFEKVQQSSGRVYLLKFKEDDRKFFFWMQEPKADGDSQICGSVNYFLNRPIGEEDEEDTSVALQTSEASDGVVLGAEVSSRNTDTNDLNIQNEASPQNTNASGPVQMSELQRILRNLGESTSAVAQDTGPNLGDILKPELVAPLIDQFPLEERLACYLPEGVWTREAFIELLQSLPFRQQLDAFSYVLQTGQVDLMQFGIDPNKYNFTVTSFLEALDDSVKTNLQSNNAASSQASRQGDSKESEQEGSGHDSMDDSH
eukprot:TRINITY_DN6834_c0_g1_i4.p1 TRINITY_DN6834_c0_g1~~TRINITY_DN6834_c0_g1_i4.p1  ORF type:complete len:332 (-),score=82.46 TRINITY_DN6834_c0_g1_i4:228-1223(-)